MKLIIFVCNLDLFLTSFISLVMNINDIYHNSFSATLIILINFGGGDNALIWYIFVLYQHPTLFCVGFHTSIFQTEVMAVMFMKIRV